jgi:L-lactate dehydrogenase complex protein LldF
LEENEALPHASSLCGACLEVCPARIDLPRMLLDLRAEEVATRVIPWPERMIETSVAWTLGHQRLFGALTAMGRVFQTPLKNEGQLNVPQALNPAGERELPALAERSFHDLWRDMEPGGEPASVPDAMRSPFSAPMAKVISGVLALLLAVWLLGRRSRR